MSSPLEQAGAVREPSEYAALSMDRGITGLWTQRSPLRDADVPYLQGKFYSASRFDSLIDGINREISAKLTYRRRPGSSVFNANNFPAGNSLYSYKRIVNGAEIVRVLYDGKDGTIYDATPGQKSTVFVKSGGADKARFQGVNTSLYFSDGVENKKWLQPGPWKAQTSLQTTQYAVGSYILDNESPTPRLQYLGSVQVATVTNVQVKTKSAILTCSGVNFNLLPGMTFKVNLGTATFLNGKLLIAQSVAGNIVTAFFDHVDYASAADTGTASTGDVGALATTGGSQPSWATSYGATTADGLSTWTNFGNPMFDWGVQPPLRAPSVASIGDSAATFWAAFQNFAQGKVLLDPNGYIQGVAFAGVSGAAVPQFNGPSITSVISTTGGVTTTNQAANLGSTTDGAITWFGSFWLGSSQTLPGPTTVLVNPKGPQPWQPNAPVNVGQAGAGGMGGDVCVDSKGNLQMVTAGGTQTGASAPAWNATYGGTTTDNGLTWRNLGPYLAIAFQGRKYGYAYHAVDASWSTLSPLSDSTNGLLEGAAVSGDYSTDLQVDSVGIFHAADGQSTPLLLATIPNNTSGGAWTFNDEWNDLVLDALIAGPQDKANNPPPLGMTAPLYHLGRMWAIYKNAVIVSGGPNTIVGNGNTAFPPGNAFPIPEQPIRLFPTITSAGPGVLVWGRANIYIILGNGTASNPFQSAALYMAGVGIQSYDAVTQIGSTFYAFGNSALVGTQLIGKAFSLDPGAGYVEYGFPIGDQFANVSTGAGGRVSNSGVPQGYLYNPASAYVTWAELGSGDTALYVADGSVGWFRYSPVASPESGFLWSPRAVQVGGTSAVQGVETQPGVSQLLIAPSGLVVGQGRVQNNILTWTKGPQFTSGMVGGTITLTSDTGATAVTVSGFISATQLQLGVTFPPTPQDVAWEIAGPGPILFRDSTVSADWYGGYTAYPSYDVKGCIQLCVSGEVGEIAHVHLVSMPQGARPSVGLLFGEILPTVAAPFAWYDRTCSEPPNLPASSTLYSDRYTMLSKGVTPKCMFFQLGMDYGTQNFADEMLMFTIFGAKSAERKQQ